jgi:hypothetical protein
VGGKFKSKASIGSRTVAKSTLDDDWHDFSGSSLGERDVGVLSLISQEALTRFTFDGLKRRLGLHPETLSRILGRLEEEGVVEKGPGGYRVTSKINDYPRLGSAAGDKSCVPLLQTLVPSNVSVEELTRNLKGKWFGVLRWLGYAEGQGEVTLKWITEDGGIQVDASVSETVLTIEAKFLRDRDLNFALKASYQLIAFIGRLCSSPQLLRHVAWYGNLDLHMMPA